MPTASARTVAWDPDHQEVLVVVQKAGKSHLARLADGELQVVRPLPKGLEGFRVQTHDGERYAVFPKGEALAFVPYEGGRAKSVKLGGSPLSRVAWRGTPPRWIVGRSVVDVTPAGIESLDGSDAPGEAWVAGRTGLNTRAVGGTEWRLVAETNRFVKGIAATEAQVVVGSYDGARVHVIDGEVSTHQGRPIWTLVAHDGAVYAKVEREVCRLEADGTDTPTGMAADDVYMDDCLFSTGAGLFFVVGHTMHRYDGERWETLVVDDILRD